MKEIKINPAHIVSVTKDTKYQHSYYEYIVNPAVMFGSGVKIGFRDREFPETIYSKDDILKKHKHAYIENDKIYSKPFIRYIMSDGSVYNSYFENEEELNAFMPNDGLITLPESTY